MNADLMKTPMKILLSGLALALVAGTLSSQADDKKAAKPYPLDTCVVSDEKLGADPGMKPYAFVHEGQEVKLCCKSCLKDFKKDQAKYLKKIATVPQKEK